MTPRIFYSSDFELIVYVVKNKVLTKVRHFQTNEEGAHQFAVYLRQDLKTPIAWLVDTIQEEYQINFLPHVWGQDRHNLLKLKMRRLFEYTPYTYATTQGREAQGRRDDRVLFIALSNPALLQFWLDIVLFHKVPIVGIYSPPLLSQRLLRFLPPAPHTLLVTHTPQISAHSVQGLRQSFFLQQKLQLSRLIPLDTNDPTGYANYIITQIIKTQRYLESARTLPANSTLSVMILSQPPLLKLLNKQLITYKDAEDIQFHLLDSREFASQIGLQTEETSLYLHHLVAGLLLRGRERNHYARLTETRYFWYQKARAALYAISLLIFIGGLVDGGLRLQNVSEINEQIQKRTEERISLETELKNLRLPQLPVDIRLIRNVVDIGRHLEAQRISPESMWVTVSKVFTQQPQLKINLLEWGIGQVPEQIFQSTLFADFLQKGGELTKETIEIKVGETEFLEGMRIYGEISPYQGNYIQALQQVNQFVKNLKQQQTAWIIRPLVLPYNMRLVKVLEGTLKETNANKNAPFAVEILIKHRYVEKST